MKVITLAKTKLLLGIDNNDSDAAITANIPIIDAKVKDISNNRFNKQIVASIETDSPFVSISSLSCAGVNYVIRNTNYRNTFCNSGINAPYVIDDISEFLQIGQLIEGDGIPAETYIDEIFENGISSVNDLVGIPVIKMSEDATETNAGQFIFLGIHIGLQPIVAKGIQYLINTTSITLPTNSLASRSIGPSSKSFSSKAQDQEGKNGMPAWFVKAFPQYQGGH